MRKTIACVLIAFLLSTAVGAAEPTGGQQDVYHALPAEAEELLEPGTENSFSGGLRSILRAVAPRFEQELHAAMKSAGVMLAALLLCAMGGAQTLASTRIAGVLCISLAGMLQMGALAGAGIDAMMQLQSFADILLPAITAGTAAAGGITASTAVYAGTALFCDVLMRLMGALLTPAIYSYVALRAAGAICANEFPGRVAGLIKWAFQNGIKLICFVFTTYLTVTGLIAGAADATVVKAAKLTLSGVVPVVGSMISDASETVIVGAAAVRNALGVFGMLAVIAICIGPFVRTAAQFLVLKAASVAGGALGQKALLELMDAICEAMGFLLSMLAASALMLLVSCVCYLKVTPG